MENFEQLTKTQLGLVDELIKEFIKINPQPTNNKICFSIDTINECLKEEERFKQTMIEHNKAIMKVFVNQLQSDVEKFVKEFGNVIKTSIGYLSKSGDERNSLNKFLEINNERPISKNDGYEISLFFISKNKKYCNDSRYDHFGKKYYEVYVYLKRERVETKLTSGKEITAYKVVGLQYCNNNWLHREKTPQFSTLDEMIQTHKPTQQKIIELVG
jgi:hypothetical protein